MELIRCRAMALFCVAAGNRLFYLSPSTFPARPGRALYVFPSPEASVQPEKPSIYHAKVLYIRPPYGCATGVRALVSLCPPVIKSPDLTIWPDPPHCRRRPTRSVGRWDSVDERPSRIRLIEGATQGSLAMIQLSRLTEAVLCFATDLRALDLHYSGKSFVCSGAECPFCEHERPRRRFYAMATQRDDHGIVELPPTLAEQILRLGAERTSGLPIGLVVELKRSKIRARWHLSRHKWRECAQTPWAEFIEQAAILFRVPIPEGLDLWDGFARIAGNAHQPLLARQLLFT